ncbi:MAG: L,D-transpeptidase [Myxococcales bacterium]
MRRASVAVVLLAGVGCRRDPTGEPPLTRVVEASPPANSASAAAASSARPAPSAPRVTLDGLVHEPAPADASGGPRVFAKALRAWVFATPSAAAAKLGYLRAGAWSRSTSKAAGFDGCPGGWFHIEPEGFVCAGPTATTDPNDPAVVATLGTLPDVSRRLPYIYGTVRKPGPVYARVPSVAELGQAEPDLGERMSAWLAADGEIGARYAPQVWLGGGKAGLDAEQAWAAHSSDPLPKFLELAAKSNSGPAVAERMKPKVGYSLLETFLSNGRRYGVTSDLTLVPIDRLRPIQGSSFHGVEVGKDVALPFAFVRSPDAKYWEYDKRAKRFREAEAAEYRAAVHLTGKQQFFHGHLHFEVDGGKWISDRDASRIDPAKRMPAWGKNGEKWLDINVTKQTLVAYEGTRPVYATLVSSGEAGLDDPEHSTATKRGIFRIHTKHLSTTMASDEVGEEFELRDVPYVQYFEDGYALHGAYWHDRFGVPKSHGCINLAPEDARRLFFFTEPEVPPGWHARLLPLKGTVVFVHA